MNKRPLVFMELNEINFDIVQSYVDDYPEKLRNLARLLGGYRICTTSESNYSELEPWIQWVSVHTGKEFKEHGIFRLGDIVEAKERQIFEVIESMGYRVGALSPMNAANHLKNPAYFIPDPWTKTPPDKSFWSQALTSSISQAVNDNAQSHISFGSKCFLLLGILRFAKIKNYVNYLKLALTSYGNPWRKALFLDLLLHDVHIDLLDANRPAFSTVFFNAGAHIQHHYFFNASPLKGRLAIQNPTWYVSKSKDPLLEVLSLYDKIIGDYLIRNNSEFLVSTGLSQEPYDQVKYYYRLNDHAQFLRKIAIPFKSVYPRMTRDFLIEFDSKENASFAQKKLSLLKSISDGLPVFGEIENRGKSLFVTLTYPKEIVPNLLVADGLNPSFELSPHVSFVAIKNGMHQGLGFSFFSKGLRQFMPPNNSHVKCLYNVIHDYFRAKTQ